MVIRTEDGDPRQKLFVHFALADGGAHEDAAVRVAVDAPQLHVRLGTDRGGAGSAVDESQLTEATALADRGHQLIVHVHLPNTINNTMSQSREKFENVLNKKSKTRTTQEWKQLTSMLLWGNFLLNCFSYYDPL